MPVSEISCHSNLTSTLGEEFFTFYKHQSNSLKKTILLQVFWVFCNNPKLTLWSYAPLPYSTVKTKSKQPDKGQSVKWAPKAAPLEIELQVRSGLRLCQILSEDIDWVADTLLWVQLIRSFCSDRLKAVFKYPTISVSGSLFFCFAAHCRKLQPVANGRYNKVHRRWSSDASLPQFSHNFSFHVARRAMEEILLIFCRKKGK